MALNDEERRLAECEGKQGFASPEKARKGIRRGARNLNVYHCRYCGKWHVGAKKP